MSRIDEAWRRASDHRAADSGVALVGDLPASRSDESSFEEYPSERVAGRTIDRPAEKPHNSAVADLPLAAPVRPSAGEKHAAPLVENRSTRNPLVAPGPPALQPQYRRLAMVLHEAQKTRGLKTVTITSVAAGACKTLASVNLALILAESYARRVLLIDADLHKPSVHDVLGIRNEAGLSETLRNTRHGVSLVEVTPLLSVLPAGHPDPDPMPALASSRMRYLLDECAERFDWVLLDTPPLSALSEPKLLARRTQAVVLVIDAASAPFSAVERAIGALGRDSVIGTVLNGI